MHFFWTFLDSQKSQFSPENCFKMHPCVTCFSAWLLSLKLLLKIRHGVSYWPFHMPCSFLVLDVFLLKIQVYIHTFMDSVWNNNQICSVVSLFPYNEQHSELQLSSFCWEKKKKLQDNQNMFFYTAKPKIQDS